MDEISKIWAISRVLRRGIGIPRSSVDPLQGLACPRRGVAKRGLGKASGTPQRSSATSRRWSMPWRSTVHNMENFGVLSCFVIPLFQGLVY